MSKLDKRVMINLENTAKYQSRSNLTVSFSTADTDSAVLFFNVTKNGQSMILTNQNVKGHIALFHSDGSFIKDTLEFNDEVNNYSQFKYSLPNQLLKRNGEVTMQILLAELGNSNTMVAERICTFQIEKSLFSHMSGETKLNYIVELDELYDRIEDRMNLFEQEMDKGEDIISSIEEARDSGLSDIEISKSNALNYINDISKEKLNELKLQSNQYTSKINQDKKYINEKFEGFKNTINDSEVVTTNYSSQWQKSKLTTDNGRLEAIRNVDWHNLNEQMTKTGFYYVSGKSSFPISGVSSTGFLILLVRSENYMYAIYSPHNTAKMFHINKDNGVWGEWFDATLNMETKDSSQTKANVAESNANRYTDNKLNEQMKVLFESRVQGVGTTIDLADSLSNYSILYIFIDYPGGEVPCIANPSGNSNIILQNTNTVENFDGGGHYKLTLQKITQTQLKIIGDIFWDFGNQRGSKPNANQHTITKIVGVKNYANTN